MLQLLGLDFIYFINAFRFSSPQIAFRYITCDDQFCTDILNICIEHLEHPEVRVRLAVAGAIGGVASQEGQKVVATAGSVIL